jgi:ATP-dependent RNA helicase RhlE
MRFSDFALSAPILAAVADEGYETPTPIQEAAIPPILRGEDLLGCAQTGTGKTAAFALPILENLSRDNRDRAPEPSAARAAPDARGTRTPARAPSARRKLKVLVLSPTRELAAQIGESFGAYGSRTGLRHTVIFGGVNQNRQIDALERGVDILVATPGRLLDLIGQRQVSLSDLTVFVLDEADRMLDMGFVHDVKRIAALVPKDRQTLLFSATMPESIRALAGSLLKHNPVEVAVTPVASTAETVSQSLYFVEKADKRALLSWVLERENIDRAIVFTRTKHGANRVSEYLDKRGVSSAAIHGNKSQNARERALAGFKQGHVRALIATDIAARGIDIDELSFVINFDLPNVPEAYVHRIGRTGRAGASGRALSFCESEERPYLMDIERLIKQHIPVELEHPYPSSLGVPRATDLAPRRGRPGPQAPSRENVQNAPRRDVREAPRRDGPRRDAPQQAQRRDAPEQSQRRDAPRRDAPEQARRVETRGSTREPSDNAREAPRRDAPQQAQRRDTARDAPAREPASQRGPDRRGHLQPHPDRAHRNEPERHAHRDRAREAR